VGRTRASVKRGPGSLYGASSPRVPRDPGPARSSFVRARPRPPRHLDRRAAWAHPPVRARDQRRPRLPYAHGNAPDRRGHPRPRRAEPRGSRGRMRLRRQHGEAEPRRPAGRWIAHRLRFVPGHAGERRTARAPRRPEDRVPPRSFRGRLPRSVAPIETGAPRVPVARWFADVLRGRRSDVESDDPRSRAHLREELWPRLRPDGVSRRQLRHPRAGECAVWRESAGAASRRGLGESKPTIRPLANLAALRGRTSSSSPSTPSGPTTSARGGSRLDSALDASRPRAFASTTRSPRALDAARAREPLTASALRAWNPRQPAGSSTDTDPRDPARGGGLLHGGLRRDFMGRGSGLEAGFRLRRRSIAAPASHLHGGAGGRKRSPRKCQGLRRARSVLLWSLYDPTRPTTSRGVLRQATPRDRLHRFAVPTSSTDCALERSSTPLGRDRGSRRGLGDHEDEHGSWCTRRLSGAPILRGLGLPRQVERKPVPRRIASFFSRAGAFSLSPERRPLLRVRNHRWRLRGIRESMKLISPAPGSDRLDPGARTCRRTERMSRRLYTEIEDGREETGAAAASVRIRTTREPRRRGRVSKGPARTKDDRLTSAGSSVTLSSASSAATDRRSPLEELASRDILPSRSPLPRALPAPDESSPPSASTAAAVTTTSRSST
jgi:hypothetical protein